MTYRVGVDIGGSFTDFAVFNETSGAITSLKVFSRPDEPGSEVLEGIRLLGERHGIRPEEINYFTHGTTVGINTVIQRKGLHLALFTTEHFRDVLELARLKIPDMYSLLSKRPAPLITRDMVWGIAGRMTADGAEETPLDQAMVEEATLAAVAAGAEGIVVALLHSYRNPAHERAVRAIVERVAPGLPVSCSSETWPIIREYERTITAVIGGYVQPRVAHYLTQLQSALHRVGVVGEPRITKSNGGVMTAEQGKHDCVQMILSGTASGVIGASYVAKICELPRCMSLDIGGTSADVALIMAGEPQYGTGERIGDFHIYVPSVSVSSIGEGGGSIASIDRLGVLHVGPESAGSRPGPACYGRGGTRPTITDAFAACGMVGFAEVGYGAVTVDRERARSAIAPLADALSRSIEQTAEAIIRIAVSGMYTEVSALVSRFGIDPREFACLAFGGAGPMMACFLARELDMPEIVVPPAPGVLSALGGLIADLKNDFIDTVYLELDDKAAIQMRDSFARLEARALTWLRGDQGYKGPHRFSYSAEMRYRGQAFELDTQLDPAAVASADTAAIAEAFHGAHEQVYGHADRHAPLQVIAIRLVIAGETAKPELPRQEPVDADAPVQREAEVWMDGQMRGIKLYRRGDLCAGHRFTGPAVVAQDDCTTVVPPGFAVTVDAYSNLRIKKEAAP